MKKKIEIGVLLGLILVAVGWFAWGPGLNGKKGKKQNGTDTAAVTTTTMPPVADLTALRDWLAPEAPDATVESLPALSYVGVQNRAVAVTKGVTQVLPKPTAIFMTTDTNGLAWIDGVAYKNGDTIRDSSLQVTAVRPQSVEVKDAAGKVYVLETAEVKGKPQ